MSLRFRVLGSGSTGNATLVEAGETRILIDAGLGPRSLAERLLDAGVDPASLAAIFVSHEHSDHSRGAAPFSAKWGVRLAGSRGTYAAAGFGAVDIAGYDVLTAGTLRRMGQLTVTAVALPHDAAEPLAFVVAADGASLGHATDFGQVTRTMVEAFRSCDALLMESNYDAAMLRDGPYPWSLKERILGPLGHVSNDDVARYLGGSLGESCRTVVLAHLSQKNNHPEVARMAAEVALRRRGRTEVQLELTSAEGTDWIQVSAPRVEATGPMRQLRLF
ncbi:MAG TPA: MBL fold metallo-hydrolase [Vicinamibacteria bacterium]|nr:MBL fold metallo-hydrolase [Vicinamibacteria bacterium]